jgi:2-polyprenyl-3-methyl-5-hydroxy-6-metoxy-1,4-benzoquinol methylase
LEKRKKVATNVYKKKYRAIKFEKSTKIDKRNLELIGEFIYNELIDNFFKNHSDFRIIDTGTGTGRTILGILNFFHKKTIRFKADCFDVSNHMLNIFHNNIKNYIYLKNCINIIEHDANKGLDNFSNYDFALIVSVLQYLNNWRKYILDLKNHLNNESYIFVAELIGWYRLLDGVFDNQINNEKDKFHYRFWKEYFHQRNLYGQWPPEISFANQSKVYKFLEKLGFLKISYKDFLWDTMISWKEVLSWIEIGPLSSLGSNIIEPKGRSHLKSIMKNYLNKNIIDINKKFEIKWGFRIYIFKLQT